MSFLNINEVKDVVKRIDGSGGIEVLADIGDHLNPFVTGSAFLDKQEDTGLGVKGGDIEPPPRNSVFEEKSCRMY